jgi:hypothetical protein
VQLALAREGITYAERAVAPTEVPIAAVPTKAAV